VDHSGRSEPIHRRLLTSDGQRIAAQLLLPANGEAANSDTALVVAHGFSGHIAKEQNRRVMLRLARQLPVVGVDLRGHGGSSGECTLGNEEVHDVAAAVSWARTRGFQRIVVVGFSMGAAVAVRYAGLFGGCAGVVAVSGPAFWNYRGTAVMRWLHFGVEHPVGRTYVRRVMRTRVAPPPWPQPWPMSPTEAAMLIPPTPFLVVHGRDDQFFPEEHPRGLIRAATVGAQQRGVADYQPELWLADFGHAEAAITDELLDRIADWASSLTEPANPPTPRRSDRQPTSDQTSTP
jgi:pimeloyl-ACP methyl ester carboxylesterase